MTALASTATWGFWGIGWVLVCDLWAECGEEFLAGLTDGFSEVGGEGGFEFIERGWRQPAHRPGHGGDADPAGGASGGG